MLRATGSWDSVYRFGMDNVVRGTLDELPPDGNS